MDDFFGMGMMVACLKQVGTSDRCSERLNMEVNTSTSWSAHPLRTRPGTPSTHSLKLSPHVSHGQGQSAVISVLGQSHVRHSQGQSAVVLVLGQSRERKGVGCLKPCVK